MENSNLVRVYTHAQAAEYLDRHIQMLNLYVRDSKLVPDMVLTGGQRLYLESTLEAFKKRWMSEDGLTLHEVVSAYGLTYHEAYYHFHRKRSVVPMAKYMRQRVYNAQTVKAIASEEGWKESAPRN